MQSISKLEHYFEQTMPQLLAALPSHTKPEWGTMDATQMLDHLNDALKLSMGLFPIEDDAIVEKWEKYKTIGLLSDKPIVKNFTNPIFNLLPPKTPMEHELAKQKLLEGYHSFKQSFASKPNDYTTIHNMFGRLNYHEWIWFHYKHFSHHFAQFSLIPYIEKFELE